MQRAKIGILGLALVIGGIAFVTQAPARQAIVASYQPASLDANDTPAVVLLGYDVPPARVERIRAHQVWACSQTPTVYGRAVRMLERLPLARAF